MKKSPSSKSYGTKAVVARRRTDGWRRSLMIDVVDDVIDGRR